MDARVLELYLSSCSRQLVHLNLEGTSFDDTCLSQLIAGGNQLISLNVARTNVTDTGFSRLSEAREE
jgi:hypothetical protein